MYGIPPAIPQLVSCSDYVVRVFVQYFLRPLLKEYDFGGSVSRSITLKDASAVTESFSATRVAYSVFGTIRSLNGEPEKNVVVEAMQELSEGSTQRRYEETVSDTNGSYRLRGLMPGLTYRIALKVSTATTTAAGVATESKDAAGGVRIERSSPAFVPVRSLPFHRCAASVN